MSKRIFGGAFALLVVLAGAGVLFLRAELPKYRDAFFYAYGPYEFVRSIQELSAQRETQDGLFNRATIEAANPGWNGAAYINRHVHNNELADETLRSVTTPNNDTLYTSAVLELSSTPVEVVLPNTGARYVSIALMDIFTDQFAHIGPRETDGAGGVYWIVGPDDTTTAPEGVTLVRAPGNDVWLLARVFVSGRADLPAARSVQEGIIVRPVHSDRPANPFPVLVGDIADSQNFIAVVNEALARNPDHPQSDRAANFAALGIGKSAQVGAIQSFFWSLVTPRAEAAITEQINRQLSSRLGWSDPPHNIGFYGEDDVTRSGIALIGFGALRREDAIYYRMTKTEDGALLNGAKRYKLILPPDVPAQAFWSISLYEPDGAGRYFFYENVTGRHSLNSGSQGLNYEADGGVTLYFGAEAPSGETSNWMPTPAGSFAAFFRVYLPTPEAVRSGWKPPAIIEE